MTLPLSTVKLVNDICSGEAHPATVVRQCIDRIKSLDSQLQAWVEVDEDAALEAANQLAERVARGGVVGPLAGVPVGIKDIFDVKGRRTGGGSPLRADHIAECDSEVVARLRAADAIILGKTVTTEFACFDPPPTVNPWSASHTPGGSSSGSAAALAAEMCMAAIGSQTGGSITRPAAFCGVTGLKPAFGRLSLAGVIPVSFHLDHPGPMARSINDLAAVWHALSGESPVATPIESPNIAVLDGDGWIPDEGQTEYQDAVAQLGDLPRLRLPFDWERLRDQHLTVMAVDAASFHREDYQREPGRFGEKIGWLIQQGLGTAAWQYAEALAAQRDFRQEVARRLAPWDAVVTPSAPGPAPSRDTTGDPKFNSPWSFSGLATVTIPCQWVATKTPPSERSDPSTVSLPIGMQLISVRSEPSLLATARWCEQRVRFKSSRVGKE